MQEKKTKSEKLTGEVATKKPVASKLRPGAAVKRVSKAGKPTLSQAVSTSPSRPKASVVKAKVETQSEKAKKERKPKLIRDSFKFPELEYRTFDALKARCLSKGYAAKKSELVRAGLLTLASLSDEELLKCVSTVEKLKTGRPAS